MTTSKPIPNPKALPATPSGRVLVVEDEPALADLARWHLERSGYAVVVAATGVAALQATLDGAQPPDLVLLDWQLPDMPGVEICRQLRARPEGRSLPIIMTTCRAEETDRVEGLDAGADDYVVKPYSPAELMVRVAAVLRRVGGRGQAALSGGGVTLDPDTRRVTRDGRPVTLGATEFRMLHCLMDEPGRVWSRARLQAVVWDNAAIQPRTIDVAVRRLREALGTPDLIRTVRAAGYAFAAPELEDA